MSFKMRGGTARSDVNLCLSCTASFRRRMANSHETVVFCNAIEQVVPGVVAECSRYHDAGAADLGSMREIAWIVSADKKKNFAGFLDPAAAKKAADEGKIDHPTEGPIRLPSGEREW